MQRHLRPFEKETWTFEYSTARNDTSRSFKRTPSIGKKVEGMTGPIIMLIAPKDPHQIGRKKYKPSTR